MKKLRAGIIGTGNISAVHLDNMKLMSDKAGVVCGCDINPQILESKSSRYGFKKYADYRDMLNSEEVDFVILAAPQMERKNPIEFCAARRIPVFTEKPPASDLKTAAGINSALEKSGCAVSVAFLFRYYAIVEKARKLLEKRPLLLLDVQYLCPMMYPEDIAKTRGFFYDKQLSGGLITDQAIHLLDLTRYMLGEEISELHAFGANRMQPKTDAITTEESVVMNMRSTGGALVSYLHTWTHRKWYAAMEIFAPDARLKLDFFANSLEGLLDGIDISYSPAFPHGSPYFDELKEFIDFIGTGEGRILSPYSDSVKTMELADGIMRSVETGAPVKLARGGGGSGDNCRMGVKNNG